MRAPIKALCAACVLFIISGMSACAQSGFFFIRKDKFGTLDELPVRILLLKTGDAVTISSESQLRIHGSDRIRSAPDRPLNRIVCTAQSIKTSARIDSLNSPISVNGILYRGGIELRAINGDLMVINIVKMDEYLSSVVPGEIPSSWGDEALRAQAIAARTYACYHLIHNRGTTPYDLDASTDSQVYRGIIVEKPSTTAAVLHTAGYIMAYRGEPILSYFHSTCGGKTVGARNVWNRSDMEYLKGVRCDFCKASTKYSWETMLKRDEIGTLLKKRHGAIGTIKSINFKKKDERVTDVVVVHTGGKLAVPGNSFRLLFSADRVRSLYFKSKVRGDGIVLNGHGWGHGVGMCQWGAKGMAEKGHTFREILRYYYTGITIDRPSNALMAARIKDRSAYQ